MPLDVIGAGFGRTGTESMKTALEIIGLGPCYHMTEVLPHPERIAMWREAAQGNPPDWEKAFAGYRSTVDWPAAFFWRELAEAFPKAKILLTVRSAESWYASMEKTILKVIRSSTDPRSLGLKLIGEGVFGGALHDRAHIVAAFERNTAEVQAAFGPERLLTFHVGDGWEPLCRFLGRPVPDVPFPHRNRPEEFDELVKRFQGSGEAKRDI